MENLVKFVKYICTLRLLVYFSTLSVCFCSLWLPSLLFCSVRYSFESVASSFGRIEGFTGSIDNEIGATSWPISFVFFWFSRTLYGHVASCISLSFVDPARIWASLSANAAKDGSVTKSLFPALNVGFSRTVLSQSCLKRCSAVVWRERAVSSSLQIDLRVLFPDGMVEYW